VRRSRANPTVRMRTRDTMVGSNSFLPRGDYALRARLADPGPARRARAANVSSPVRPGIELVLRARNWREDRVWFHDVAGHLRSLPANWTDAMAEESSPLFARRSESCIVLRGLAQDTIQAGGVSATAWCLKKPMEGQIGAPACASSEARRSTPSIRTEGIGRMMAIHRGRAHATHKGAAAFSTTQINGRATTACQRTTGSRVPSLN
jgi:hypothetical protein